jgi:pimeloyl-ACP methyl ester carboxylesterase
MGRTECNPLGYPEACMLPFPSMYYYESGHVNLPAAAMPVSRGRLTNGDVPVPLRPDPWNSLAGFSPSAPLLAYFPERIDAQSLVPPEQMARSVTAMASTAIVDMETGERVAHFSEVDATATADDPQVVIIRPAQRLKPGHRYAVAITKAIRTTSGTQPAIPPGMRALLENTPQRDSRLARVAPRYTEIFAALQRAGITRDNLVLAWDYTTATEANLTGSMVAMRDTALTMVGERGAGFTVTQVEENYNAQILRRVSGTFEVPLFLTSTTDENGRIQRDANGAPRASAMHNVNFVAMVPRSAETRGPLPLLLFGHGLFGSGAGELGLAASPSYMQRFLNDQGFIAVATDWTGLSASDNATAAQALADMNYFTTIADRLQQSLINAMVLYRTARAQFSSHMAFAVNGRSSLDSSRAYYYGISLGGIMGTSFLGYSPDCDRGVVNVAGGNWSMLLQRSSNFRAFEFAFGDYQNRVDRQVILSLLQSQLDPVDPINLAPHLLRDRLPGVPEKHVLYQIGVGDAQVNNLASESVVRSMNIPLLLPSPRTPYGIPTAMGPQDSAFTIWDDHPTPAPDGTNTPSPNNTTHGRVRDITELKEQIRRFLQPGGRVEHTCDGPCDPQ